jgi:hypothetical protein
MQRFACLTDDELTSELMTLYTFADDRALQSAVQSASNFFKLARHCKRVVAVGYGGALVRPGAETQPFISALCTGLLRSTYAPLPACCCIGRCVRAARLPGVLCQLAPGPCRRGAVRVVRSAACVQR